jgi:hypothetical protein
MSNEKLIANDTTQPIGLLVTLCIVNDKEMMVLIELMTAFYQKSVFVLSTLKVISLI